nr:sporulation protein YpjB [Cohnella mopanensis]
MFGNEVHRSFKLRLLLIFVGSVLFMLVVAPSRTWGNGDSNSAVNGHASIERFLSASESLYQAVNKGNLDVARSSLSEIELQFRNLPMKMIGTAEGIHALANSITDLKRAAAAVSPDERKWKSGAAALRLAADALAHPNKPIWHQYRTVLREDIVRINKALPQGTAVKGQLSANAKAAFDQLTEHYRVIRTAVMLQSEPWKIERSDSVVRYASRVYQADTPSTELLLGTIPPLQEALEGLFPVDKDASTAIVPPIAVAPPSWGWSAMMGSFIVTILTWVGWRRYKNEEYGNNDRGGSRTNPSEDAAQRWMNKWKNKG